MINSQLASLLRLPVCGITPSTAHWPVLLPQNNHGIVTAPFRKPFVAGIFNTLYYTVAFVFFWFCVAKVPAGQGTAATAKAFAAVMAGVWAGSQVTKALRAALALALAPLVDRMMGAAQGALGLKSKRAVFPVLVAACFGLAGALFGVIVLAWS